jgi:tripartite-type tricarboxylate transporter receptor subunit TctC
MKKNQLRDRSPWIGIVLISFVLALILAPSAWAQDAQKKFPAGPVKIVCAQKAGGSNDTVSRTFAPFFSKYLNTPVVVENVEGAGGKIGRTQVYKSKPDGYTLVLTGLPASYLGQKLENPEYKLELMTPIYNVSGGDYNATAVLYDSPVKTIADLKKFGQTKNIKG